MPSRRLAAAFLLAPALAAQAGLPRVHERRLPNGVRVLLVDEPGSGAFHARCCFRWGAADLGELPADAVDRVSRALYGRVDRSDIERDPALEALLEQQAGTFEALRRERLGRRRDAGVDLATGLSAVHEKLLARLGERLPSEADPDLLEALGAARRAWRVGPDTVEAALDLPSAALRPWLRLEAARLATLALARLPLLPPARGPVRRGDLDQLLGAAYPGRNFGLAREETAGEGLGWSEARALARRIFTPDRMLLVLVGDLRAEPALEAVTAALGGWKSADAEPSAEPAAPERPSAPGARRLQAHRSGTPKLFLGWRIPPADHPDTPALRLLAQILGEGRGSRLRRALQAPGIARDVQVLVGIPGGRQAGLLAVAAVPEEGHGLRELAQVIEGEVMRLQREAPGPDEFGRVQQTLDLQQLLVQSDPARLAAALGEAACAAGDWRLAFPRPGATATRAEDLQRAARAYLVPEQRVEVLLEPDPLEEGQDPLDRQLSEALRRLAAARIREPQKLEEAVRDGMRQLRMLSREDREAALKLLHSRREGR